MRLARSSPGQCTRTSQSALGERTNLLFTAVIVKCAPGPADLRMNQKYKRNGPNRWAEVFSNAGGGLMDFQKTPCNSARWENQTRDQNRRCQCTARVLSDLMPQIRPKVRLVGGHTFRDRAKWSLNKSYPPQCASAKQLIGQAFSVHCERLCDKST